MKTVLLHIHQDKGQEARLQFALDLGRAYGAHLACVQITPLEAYMGGDLFGGSYIAADILADIREQQAKERERIEAHLEREGVSWDWKQIDGSIVRTLISEARLVDALVLSQYQGGGEEMPPLPIVADVAIHAPAPVFVVPCEVKPFLPAGKVAIAWNGSPEAASALRHSLTFLKVAESVHIIEVTDDKREFPSISAAEYLARHGITAEVHEWQRHGRDTAATLRYAARDLGAAYMVMGAYGHSRLRETVLGGVTRSLLADSEIPLLLGH